MEIFVKLLGFYGVMIVTGVVVFLYCFKYSQGIFDWIERQTFGTRSYILEKLEMLFIEVDPNKITYMLLFISVGMGGIFFLLFGFMGQWFLGGVISIGYAFIGFKIPRKVIDFLVKKRIAAYSSQMVDALQLLSNGIRAGLSVPQSLGMVVGELPPPISQEFNVILQQNKIGVPLEECFDNLAQRVPTEDNDMFVSGVNILRETGGNLAETFDTIVGVIRERVRLQQKIDTYVAQGMFQGMVIFMMPFAIGGIFAASDPNSMIRVFQHPLGIILMIVALALDLLGAYVIFKIVDIKV